MELCAYVETVNRGAPLLLLLALACGQGAGETKATPAPSTVPSAGSGISAPGEVVGEEAYEGTQFLAIVQRVEKHATWRFDPPNIATTPVDLLIGPATLHVSDGTQLHVPARTRGGNACMEFVHTPQDRDGIAGFPDASDRQVRQHGGFSSRCVIVGRLKAANVVSWFRILKLDGNAALLGRITSTDETTITSDGLTWPVAPGRRLCPGYESIRELMDAARGRGTGVTLDVRTREVTSIHCPPKLF